MTGRPSLAELVAAVDDRLRELGWTAPYPEAPFIWHHPAYGVWSHDSAVGIAIRVTNEPERPRLQIAADEIVDELEHERVYGSSRERLG